MGSHNSLRGFDFPFSWKIKDMKTFHSFSFRSVFVSFVLATKFLPSSPGIGCLKGQVILIHLRPFLKILFNWKGSSNSFEGIGWVNWDPFPKSFEMCACFLKCRIHNGIIHLQLYFQPMYWNIDLWAALPLQLSVSCCEIHWQIKLRNQREKTRVLLVEKDLEALLITLLLGLAHPENSSMCLMKQWQKLKMPQDITFYAREVSRTSSNTECLPFEGL